MTRVPRVSARTALGFVATLLVVASVVSWRKGVLYSGGVDPFVAAKALVALLAAGIALGLFLTARARRTLSPYPTLLVLTIVAVSVIGGLAHGSIRADGVLAVRITLLSATLLLLLTVHTSRRLLAMLLTSMASIGLLAAGTGAIAMVLGAGSRSRLGGGIPPLEPNELATLLLAPAIALTALAVQRGRTAPPLIAAVVLAGVIAWTGSRTALLMLVVGAVIAVVTTRRPRRRTVLIALAAAAAVVGVLAATNVLADLALRGEGVARLLTLNSRTISWSAVLATPKDSLAWWIGNGLSMKQIAVSGQYWQQQVFDSSWISSIAQDGLIGTVLLAAYVVGTVVAAGRSAGLRSLVLPIVLTTLVRSFVENGLIESSVTFALFFTIAIACWPGTPAELTPRESVVETPIIAPRPRVEA